MKIQVTKKDINKGIIEDVHYCPIARAVKRIVKKNAEVTVNGTSVTITVPLTAQMQRFVEKFDNEEAVGPFSFTL